MQADGVSRSAHGRRARARRRGRAAGRVAAILALVALVVLPVAFAEWPREVARWLAAAAREHELDAQYTEALADLDRALQWDPENAQLYAQRAQLRQFTEQWEAGLEDCNRASVLAPGDQSIRELRTVFLQHAGRSRDAVAVWRALLGDAENESPPERARLLNDLAYARAVAGVELPEALRDVQQALDLAGSTLAQWDPLGLLWFGRAGSARMSKEDELALQYYGESLRVTETVYDQNRKRAEALAATPKQAAPYRQRAVMLKAHLVGVLFQRAEVLDQLQRTEEAARDRDRIKELNQDGNLSMSVPLTMPEAVDVVTSTAEYLDTRGYLHLRLGDFRQARQDLELAVTMCLAVEPSYDWLVEALKYRILDIRILDAGRRAQRANVAVIRYHLMVTLTALGLEAEAAAQRAAIRELGFDPGTELL